MTDPKTLKELAREILDAAMSRDAIPAGIPMWLERHDRVCELADAMGYYGRTDAALVFARRLLTAIEAAEAEAYEQGRREALGDVRDWLSELTTSTRNRVASKPWSERREGYADGVESVEGDFSVLWPKEDDDA